jgi:hypothetical protein
MGRLLLVLTGMMLARGARGAEPDLNDLKARLDRLQAQVQKLESELGRGAVPVKPAGATTARSPATPFADSANVRDFGAIADGAADDTAAVRSAYGAVKAHGGTIFFPPGVYRFNLMIVDPNIRLVGAGFGDDKHQGATVFRPQNLTQPVIQIGDGIAPVSAVELSHFSIHGDGASPRSDGLVVLGAAHISIHHVWVSSFGRDNISITSSATQPTQFIYLSDFMSKWARGAGLRAVYGPQWTTAVDLANFAISGNSTPSSWAVYLDGVTAQAVNGYMDVHPDHGIYLSKRPGYPEPAVRGSHLNLDVGAATPGPAATFGPELKQRYVGSYITGTAFSTVAEAMWLSNGAAVPMGTDAEQRVVWPHVLGKLMMARQGVPNSTDLENAWGRLTVEDYTGSNAYWNFNTDANDGRVALRAPGSFRFPLQFQSGGALYVDQEKQLRFSRGQWWPTSDSAGLVLAAFVPTPASPQSQCLRGDWAADDHFLYVCHGSNQWRRVPTSPW